MTKQQTPNTTSSPWSAPLTVEQVPEEGKHIDLVADEALRAAIAKVAGLRELPQLKAHFDVMRRGADGLHVTGLVSATVGQTCVVTLEPLTNAVEEKVDLVFLPQAVLERLQSGDEEAVEPREIKWNDPEPLIGGTVDLGAVATEFLILGLDPYPRKADAVFEPPAQDKAGEGPFSALAKLKS
ncbi:MAG TPA: DUF177 domain-containing protein [Xanthobacteraceae bacterium]|jgi:hypothetical protein|nr:DUF177 domain-containing protein [Xanthobacteraceae bacterium]